MFGVKMSQQWSTKCDCSRLDPFFSKLLKTSHLCCYLVLIISFEHLKVIYLQSPKACQQNHHKCCILSAFHSLMAPKNQRKQNPDQNFLPIPGLFDISLEKCWRDSRSNCTFIWCSFAAVASCASSLRSGIRPSATRCNVSTVLTCQGEVTADPPHWHSRCFPANVYKKKNRHPCPNKTDG